MNNLLKAVLVFLCVLISLQHLSAQTNLVMYAGSAAGNEEFFDVKELSDGTFLVAGTTSNPAWLSSLPLAPGGVRNQMNNVAVTGTGDFTFGIRPIGSNVGFILHLSADMSQILNIVHFAQGIAGNIRHIKSTEIPGSPTGALYISGSCSPSSGSYVTGYFIARLNNNFVSGVPTDIVWAKPLNGNDIHGIGSQFNLYQVQPWDVGTDSVVYFADGENNEFDFAGVYSLRPNGFPNIVPNFRRHWNWNGEKTGTIAQIGDTTGLNLYRSGIVLKFANNNTDGRADLRSWTADEYNAILPDGNGGTKKGTYPNDALFTTHWSLSISPRSARPGYIGYTPETFRGCHSASALVIDRRDNSVYIGYHIAGTGTSSGSSIPAVVAFDKTGKIKWWSRLMHEIRPGETTPRKPDNITIVDALAIDYSGSTADRSYLVVQARAIRKTGDRLWKGLNLYNQPTISGFKQDYTGTDTTKTTSWLGKLRLNNGDIYHATYVAEGTDNDAGSAPTFTAAENPLLEGWVKPNRTSFDVERTELARNGMYVAPDGAVCVIGYTEGRAITTSTGYQQMPKTGSVSANSFARIYTADLNSLLYSSLLTGGTTTAPAFADLALSGVIKTSTGIVVVGKHVSGNIPTANAPAWASNSKPGANDAVIAYFGAPCYTNANFYVKEFCDAGKVDIINTSSTISSTATYQWMIDNVLVSTNKDILGYSFAQKANYNIRLITTDGVNGCKDTADVTYNAPFRMIAAFTGLNLASTGTPQTFTNTSSLDPDGTFQAGITYSWKVDGSEVATTKDLIKTFATPGIYNVRLVVKSNSGCLDSVEKQIDIRTASVKVGKTIVAFAGASGNESFTDVVRMSDNTFLVSGYTTDLAWLTGLGASITKQLSNPSGGIKNERGLSPNNISFILRLSQDMSTVLGVFYLPAGTAVDIRHIKTTNVPGMATGDIYFSGTGSLINSNSRKSGGYFIAKLNNNLFDATTDIAWANTISINSDPSDMHGIYHPWDVDSNGRVIYASGDALLFDFVSVAAINPDGTRDSLGSDNSTQFHLKPRGTGDRNALRNLRSLTIADYKIMRNGNGGYKQGKYPLDIYHDGTQSAANLDGFPLNSGTSGMGVSGFILGRFNINNLGVSSIVIDRRNNDIYMAITAEVGAISGDVFRQPFIYAGKSDGKMKWFSRLTHDITPTGDTLKLLPSQTIAGMAIDYSEPLNGNAQLVVQATTANDAAADNLFKGNEIFNKPEFRGFQNRYTGIAKSTTIAWLGRFKASTGDLIHASYIGEYDQSATVGSPSANPLLDGFAEPNSANPELARTVGAVNALKVSPTDGSVTFLGNTDGRAITTSNAYQKMPKTGGVATGVPFVRVYTPDLRQPVYSSLAAAGTTTVPANATLDIRGVFNTGSGIAMVGKVTNTATLPTTNVPAWANSATSGTESAVIMYQEPTCQTKASLYADNTCGAGALTIFNTSTSLTSVFATSWKVTGMGITDSLPAANLNGKHLVYNFPIQGATYKVLLTVTDMDGCSDTASIQVVSPKPFKADFDTIASVCAGTKMSFIDKSSFNPTFPLTYSWDYNNDGIYDSLGLTANTTSFAYATSGAKQVKLRIMSTIGCVDSVVKTVTVKSSPTVAFTLSSTCDSVLNVGVNETSAISGATITSKAWTFGNGMGDGLSLGTSFIRQYDSAGVYDVKLRVEASNGCSDTLVRSVRVYPRGHYNTTYSLRCTNTLSSFSSLPSLTKGDTISEVFYNFGEGGGFVRVFNGKDTTYAFTTSGTKNITVRIKTTSGCDKDSTFTLTVPDRPDEVLFRVSLADTCVGVPTKFTFNPFVSLTDVIASTAIDFDINASDVADSVVLTQNKATNVYSSAQVYTAKYTIKTGLGCIIDTTFNVNIGTRITPLVYQIGDQLTANEYPNATFQWFRNNVAVPANEGGRNRIFITRNFGDYYVTTVSGVCEGSSSVISVTTITGLADKTIAGVVDIFPNPASTYLNVVVTNEVAESITFRMVDVLGKEIVNKTVSKTEASAAAEIDMSYLPSGIYLLEITQGNARVVKRVSKQ